MKQLGDLATIWDAGRRFYVMVTKEKHRAGDMMRNIPT